jgi:two-component system, NarL family, invasion response regulator UvrY
MIRILVVDDHVVVRKGLVSILSEMSDPVLVEEAGSGEEALDKVRQGAYHLVLLDITMPDMRGLEVLQEIKAGHPELPVLMLSMHPEEQYAVQSLRAGASGYLMKGSAANELLGAVGKVLAGGKYIGAQFAEKLAYGLINNAEKAPHETLSAREYQVLLKIAAGKSTGKIAEETSLSIKTINTFRSRLLLKMRLKSNVELAHYVMRHNLVE